MTSLKTPRPPRKLEQDTGLNRERLEELAAPYKKVKSPPAGPGREIEVNHGEQTDAKPSANLPGLNSNVSFSTRNVRDRGTMAQDDVRNNIEGIRHQVPSEWRGKWEGYRNKLGKVAAPKRVERPSVKPGQ